MNYGLIFFCIAGIIFCFGYVILDRNNDPESPYNIQKRQKEKFSALALQLLKQNPSIFMAKSIKAVLSTPEDTLFVFIANEDHLLLQSQASSTIEYVLTYDKIVSFQSDDVVSLENKASGMYRIEMEKETRQKRLHIAYKGKEGLLSLDFVYDKTYEDRAFNEIASQGEDIFTYVNARIPKQDNTVIL